MNGAKEKDLDLRSSHVEALVTDGFRHVDVCRQ